MEGVLLEEDMGVLHPEGEEGVGQPEIESESSQLLEETGVCQLANDCFEYVNLHTFPPRVPTCTV